jgi:hypothetical protein
MELILISISFVAIAFLLLGLNIFFRKDGKFPETEVGRNKQMRNLGITCPKCDEIQAWREVKKRGKLKIKPSELKIDLS